MTEEHNSLCSNITYYWVITDSSSRPAAISEPRLCRATFSDGKTTHHCNYTVLCNLLYYMIVRVLYYLLSLLYYLWGLVLSFIITTPVGNLRAARNGRVSHSVCLCLFNSENTALLDTDTHDITHFTTRHYTFYYTIQLATLQCLCTFQRTPRYCTLIQLIRHILLHHTTTILHSVCLGTFQAENTALLHTHTVNCQLSIVNSQWTKDTIHTLSIVHWHTPSIDNCQLSIVSAQKTLYIRCQLSIVNCQ